jgi:hypothetical protein
MNLNDYHHTHSQILSNKIINRINSNIQPKYIVLLLFCFFSVISIQIQEILFYFSFIRPLFYVMKTYKFRKLEKKSKNVSNKFKTNLELNTIILYYVGIANIKIIQLNWVILLFNVLIWPKKNLREKRKLSKVLNCFKYCWQTVQVQENHY